MNREKLVAKIEKINNQLNLYEEKLLKMTPKKPIEYKTSEWNSKKQRLEPHCNYKCWYCGESLRRGTKKHKCGYLIDWNF